MKDDQLVLIQKTRSYAMLFHSFSFFFVCIILTPKLPQTMLATHPNLENFLLFGIIYYVIDLILVYIQYQTIKDSFIIHHIIAIVFSFLFLNWRQGFVHYQFYGWNEVAPIFHQLSYFIPKTNLKLKRIWQIFYQICYILTYIILIYYLLTIETSYYFEFPRSQYLFNGVLHNHVLKGCILCLVGLELYWLKESCTVLVWLIQNFPKRYHLE